MKGFFVAAACLTLALGIAWLAFPGAMFSSWGVQADSVSIYMARRYAAMFFGYAVILLAARDAPPSQALRAILAGGATVSAVMTAVSLAGALSGIASLWSAVAIEVLLVGGFIYFYLTARPR